MASNQSKLSTNSLIALCSVVALIMLVITIFIGRSFFQQITHNSRVISKKQQAESTLKANLVALPELAQAYQNLGGQKQMLEDSLPTTSDFPALVATMESIAGTSGVSLTSVAPQSSTASASATTSASTPPPTVSSPSAAVQSINGSTASTSLGSLQTTGPTPYTFTINIKGPYDKILQFLSSLQVSSRPIKITDVQLTGTTTALTGTVMVQTYYFDPQVLADKTEAVK